VASQWTDELWQVSCEAEGKSGGQQQEGTVYCVCETESQK
jgi:hypothetical protein